MKRSKDRPPEKPPERPFHNPFASLGGLREALPPGEAPQEPGPQPAEPAPERAVVRYERKGHGGKEVTLVEQLGLPSASLERWLKELKPQLGCGGSVAGAALLFQGDQRKRLPELLRARGVKKITVS